VTNLPAKTRVGGSLVRRSAIALSACALLAVTAVACTSATSSNVGSGGARVKGGTATFAEPPGVIPNWILPFVSTTDYSYFGDFDWDWQMWRPVYFVGTPTSPDIDFSESLAYPPVFTNNDTTVTITLKPWKWSDGTPITARNVLFFFNILKVEKLNWWLYIPGTFPDDVKSASIVSLRTIRFQLIHSYNPDYFTQNELQSLTPLPMAWDRTSLSGPRGSGSTVPAGTGAGLDMTPSGARAVYNFLLSQNKLLSQYTTNWLWKIVDGPFKLSAYNVDGQTSLVPNKEYGGVQPSISELTFLPFTSESTEFAQMESGTSIDVGYTSYADASRAKTLSGYTLNAWPAWAISYWFINFNNPAASPMFDQLYIRDAMQYLIDQNTIDKYVYYGYGVPSLGSVPLSPANPYLTSQAKAYPYPYDPAKAISLLKQHGWTVHPGGISVCSSPGSGLADCGAGIKAGQQLSFTLLYSNGVPEDETQSVAEKTSEALAGIDINLRPVSPAALFTDAPICSPSQAACSWQLMSYVDYTPFPYPISAINFGTGGVYNFGSYTNAQADALLHATETAPQTNGLDSALFDGENFLLQQEPGIYQPVTPYQLSLVANNLHGVIPQSPELAITPELWYFTKG
jgi:peptide/nickel transport system substrate-binding protein